MAADGFSCPTGLDGSAAVRWIEVLLRECAYSTRDTASVCLGYTSIAAWLLAQLPQLWHNWRAGSSESLSLLFVFNWLAGDVTNLLGCILTHQLPFQTYLAAYFVFIDACLFGQTVALRCLGARSDEDATLLFDSDADPARPQTQACEERDEAADESRPRAAERAGAGSCSPANSTLDDDEHTPLLGGPPNTKGRAGSPSTATSNPLHPAGRRLIKAVSAGLVLVSSASAMPLETPAHFALLTSSLASASAARQWPDLLVIELVTLGRVLAWTCTVLYLTSRLPQIMLNARRGSCAGLSISMFSCALAGNSAYALSIVAKSTEPEFLLGSLPYLLGSAGTIVFDLVILGQYFRYPKQ